MRLCSMFFGKLEHMLLLDMRRLDFLRHTDVDTDIMLGLWLRGRTPVRAFFQFRLDNIWDSKHTRVAV